MRQARLKAPRHWHKAYYHCISRVVDRQFLLGPEEKEHFVKLMRRKEAFSKVRVVAFCIMDNHFHLLVDESPDSPAMPDASSPSSPSDGSGLMDDASFLAHLDATCSRFEALEVRQKFDRWTLQGHREPMDALKASYVRRMGDVSVFMKALKQEFTQWFNRRHQRQGTLWESRFKSVLLNGCDGEALATMAAYIDLNPVRAGLVHDPQDYRWCSYAQARAGKARSRLGLKQIVDTHAAVSNRQPVTASQAVELYAEWMVLSAQEAEEVGTTESGHVLRRGLTPEQVQEVLRSRGKLDRPEALRCRVRYFSDGAVLGSKATLEDLFQSQRSRFGPQRKNAARRLRGVDLPGVFSLRDLRKEVVVKS
ncbi:MAG: transposase [Candidatus Methylacidiphilales bacterium]